MRRHPPTLTPLRSWSAALLLCCLVPALLSACAADDEAVRGLHATYLDGVSVGPKVVF